jgi:hypothetical protein
MSAKTWLRKLIDADLPHYLKLREHEKTLQELLLLVLQPAQMFLMSAKMAQSCILCRKQPPMYVSPRQPQADFSNKSKHLGRNLSVELGPRNITTNVVAPGFFPSKLASGLIEKLGGTAELEQANPRKRLGEPEDIAGVMIYLCSPAGSYL